MNRCSEDCVSEQEKIRFTTKENVLYVIPLDWPNESFTVKALSTQQTELGTIESITLLGHEAKLEWTQDNEGLTISTPMCRPATTRSYSN